MTFDIHFDKLNKSHWIASLSEARQRIGSCESSDVINFHLNTKIAPTSIEPWHIVSLACILDLAYRHINRMNLFAGNEMLAYLRDDLHLNQYFQKSSYVDSNTKTILNLWKINTKEALFYSARVSEYLKQTYFRGKDISMLQIMMDELYANIADHANANDIAYSFIQYNPSLEVISVAFCDFGIGIPQSLINNNRHPIQRCNYIQYATQRGVTVKSSIHNAGYGLATVLDCMEGSNHYLQIISNNELYYHLNAQGGVTEKTFTLNNGFEGTLIFYNLDISQFQSEEILGSGDLISDLNW